MKRNTNHRTILRALSSSFLVLTFSSTAQAQSTERISVGKRGTLLPNAGPSIPGGLSSDGRYLAFFSSDALVAEDLNSTGDVYVKDRMTGKFQLISVAADGTPGDYKSGYLDSNMMVPSIAISADGRYVAFSSQARNLVPGDTNDAEDTFVKDRITGAIQRVSVAANGTQANKGSIPDVAVAISADGRYIVFSSVASNLVACHGRTLA